jgi:hypothetical protein
MAAFKAVMGSRTTGFGSESARTRVRATSGPRILEKIKGADILCIGTPIWFGVRGSVAQMVIERLDGTYTERNEAGQYPLYNKVGCVVVTGNEDGAHPAAETTRTRSGRRGGWPTMRSTWHGSFARRRSPQRATRSMRRAVTPRTTAEDRPPARFRAPRSGRTPVTSTAVTAQLLDGGDAHGDAGRTVDSGSRSARAIDGAQVGSASSVLLSSGPSAADLHPLR